MLRHPGMLPMGVGEWLPDHGGVFEEYTTGGCGFKGAYGKHVCVAKAHKRQVSHKGDDCWKDCGASGPCEFCGPHGMCCRFPGRGWRYNSTFAENGCGSLGTRYWHTCMAIPIPEVPHASMLEVESHISKSSTHFDAPADTTTTERFPVWFGAEWWKVLCQHTEREWFAYVLWIFALAAWYDFVVAVGQLVLSIVVASLLFVICCCRIEFSITYRIFVLSITGGLRVFYWLFFFPLVVVPFVTVDILTCFLFETGDMQCLTMYKEDYIRLTQLGSEYKHLNDQAGTGPWSAIPWVSIGYEWLCVGSQRSTAAMVNLVPIEQPEGNELPTRPAQSD